MSLKQNDLLFEALKQMWDEMVQEGDWNECHYIEDKLREVGFRQMGEKLRKDRYAYMEQCSAQYYDDPKYFSGELRHA